MFKQIFKSIAQASKKAVTYPVDQIKDGVGLVKVERDGEKLLEIARQMGIHKDWYTSKTMWFNLVSVLLELAQHLAGMHVISDEYMVFIALVGNAILRCLTSGSLNKDVAITMIKAALEALPKAEAPADGQ